MPHKRYIFILLMMSIGAISTAQEDYPVEILKNRQLQLKVYPPDIEQGFYRAARFDWAGVIGSVKFNNHEFIGHWLDAHDPLNHESITGPVEAFSPIGYEDCSPGETFLIIGVGWLEKPDERPYHFATPYKIADNGIWSVEKKKREIRFVQKLQDHAGISYQYTKIIKLLENEPGFVLEHELLNTGSKELDGTVYNHNFFIIDDEPTGPNIETNFPYPILAEGRGFGDMISARDSSLHFTRPLQKGESVYTSNIEGYEDNAEDYQINIENLKTGAGINIHADQPLDKLAYWACHSTACPEPFIAISVAPGETFTWSITYEFYAK